MSFLFGLSRVAQALDLGDAAPQWVPRSRVLWQVARNWSRRFRGQTELTHLSGDGGKAKLADGWPGLLIPPTKPILWVPRPFGYAQGRLLRFLQGWERCCRHQEILPRDTFTQLALETKSPSIPRSPKQCPKTT